MSKQVKQKCQQMMMKIEERLQDLLVSMKIKKGQSILEKLLASIINDFKFLFDEVKIILHHLDFLQIKSFEKDDLICQYQKQLIDKNAGKKIIQQMMRVKYDKLAKEHQFLEFAGKNATKEKNQLEKCKSELLKKGLSELQKDLVESNKKLCAKVRILQNQIQIEEPLVQVGNAFQNSKKGVQEQNTFIAIKPNTFSSPSKTLQKKQKFKALNLALEDITTAHKTKSKERPCEGLQSKETRSCKQKEESQKFAASRNKKQELAELIAQQSKIIVSRERYFSTDI